MTNSLSKTATGFFVILCILVVCAIAVEVLSFLVFNTDKESCTSLNDLNENVNTLQPKVNEATTETLTSLMTTFTSLKDKMQDGAVDMDSVNNTLEELKNVIVSNNDTISSRLNYIYQYVGSEGIQGTAEYIKTIPNFLNPVQVVEFESQLKTNSSSIVLPCRLFTLFGSCTLTFSPLYRSNFTQFDETITGLSIPITQMRHIRPTLGTTTNVYFHTTTNAGFVVDGTVTVRNKFVGRATWNAGGLDISAIPLFDSTISVAQGEIYATDNFTDDEPILYGFSTSHVLTTQVTTVTLTNAEFITDEENKNTMEVYYGELYSINIVNSSEKIQINVDTPADLYTLELNSGDFTDAVTVQADDNIYFFLTKST